MMRRLRRLLGRPPTREAKPASKPTFELPDPRPTAASAPYTFFLPSEAEIAAVSAGDLVRVLFEYPHETETWAGERMWVMVDAVDGDDLHGTLDNIPDEPTSPLHHGDRVTVQRHQLLDIVFAEGKAAPPPLPHREYWERCLVDQCVLDGTEPVEFIYREAPDMDEEGHRYPDSGWRIRGRMGDATDEEIEDRDVAYVAIGLVLNQDDSWLPFVDAPVGTRLMRDFETGEYVEEAGGPVLD